MCRWMMLADHIEPAGPFGARHPDQWVPKTYATRRYS